MTSRSLLRTVAVGAVLLMPAAPALAASCGTGSFEAWLADFKNEAAAKGISQSAIASGLSGLTLDQAVLSRDRSQRVFSQSFEGFSGRMVPPRLSRGGSIMKPYGSVLAPVGRSYCLSGQLPGRLRLPTRQGLGARQRKFRCPAAVEQERGLCQDRRIFRKPARPRTLIARGLAVEKAGRPAQPASAAGVVGHAAHLHCLRHV